MERKVATRRTVQGVVVSDKNDKTIVVLVETHKRHAKYGKRVKYGKKYYAHDENNEAKNGDTVTIMETRRLSATKRFRLVSIDKKAVLSVKEAEAELKEEILEAEVKEAPKAEEVKVEEVKAEEAPKEEATPAKKPAARKAKAKKEEEPKEESK
jgi:small subunit ribosomal protein S17